MAEIPVGPVQFEFGGLGARVDYVAEHSHHWYDRIWAVVQTVLAYIRGWREPEVETVWSTKLLVKKWKQVGPSAVMEWEGYLRRERPEGRPFTMVNQWLFPHASQTLAQNQTAEDVRDEAFLSLEGEFQRVPRDGLLFVPLIIGQGLLEVNHIVWVTADLQTEQIEYYDPKGVVIEGAEDKDRLVRGVIAALMAVSGFETVVQNPVRHQYDINNCGVHGMSYLSRRRRTDKTFADFCLSKGADIGEIRMFMAEEMREKQPPVEEASGDGVEALMDFGL